MTNQRVWRTGRSIGRTIYIQSGDAPSRADQVIGMMDTRELADYVVEVVNEREELLQANSKLLQDLEFALPETAPRVKRLREERDKWVREAQKAGVLGRKAADKEWKQRLDKETADWSKVVNEQEVQLQYRQNLINERDTAIAALEERISELELQMDLIEKGEKIAALYQEVGEMGANIASQTDAAIKAQDEHRKLRQENNLLNDEIERLLALVKESAEENSLTTLSLVTVTQRMIAELDHALHGETYARDQTPQEVWNGLLAEIQLLRDTTKHRESLEADLVPLLNYWGVDSDLSTPDFILANHLFRHLMALKQMLESTDRWETLKPVYEEVE